MAVGEEQKSQDIRSIVELQQKEQVGAGRAPSQGVWEDATYCDPAKIQQNNRILGIEIQRGKQQKENCNQRPCNIKPGKYQSSIQG